MFLTHDELVAELARYTYRPGWSLSLLKHPWEGSVFVCDFQAPDSTDPSETADFRVKSHVPPMQNVEQFGYWLVWRLGMIESHESREFLHRDGAVWQNPHVEF